MALNFKAKKGELIQSVKECYVMAKHDLEKAEDDLKRGWFSDSCFFSQQAAEKILKAFLRSQGVVVRGHRLEKLILLAGKQGLNIDEFLKMKGKVEELSEQYMSPRYPNFKGRTARKLEEYDRLFAESCLEVTMKIWERVIEKLKGLISE